MSLFQRSLSSLSWNSATSIVRVAILFGRSVLLSRLLAVETFGDYATAGVVTALSGIVFRFGLADAFIHRSKETEDESTAAAAHFSINLLLTLAWWVVIVAIALLFYDGAVRLAIIVIALADGITRLCVTARLILTRRVVHRRLALLDTSSDIVMSLVAVAVAFWLGDIWALLSTQIVLAIMSVLFLYVWRPVWLPRWEISAEKVRYFLRFGGRSMGASLLQLLLDRGDDFFISTYLGSSPLGFYSRAYAFASYPRKVLALPLNSVAFGAYAELKGQRHALSKYFFNINALLIRTGFAFAGILALIAPEFIRILLGEKWMPFEAVFRLMLIFTLLDPIKVTVGHLFIAAGQPEQLIRVRLVQLAILLVGMFALAPTYGIIGVAVAVNIMLTVGIALLLWRAQEFVDFSAVQLFLAPTAALVVGMFAGRLALRLPNALASDWHSGATKLVVFPICYIVVLLILERQQLITLMRRFGLRNRASVLFS